jgi:hypothetical protein
MQQAKLGQANYRISGRTIINSFTNNVKVDGCERHSLRSLKNEGKNRCGTSGDRGMSEKARWEGRGQQSRDLGRGKNNTAPSPALSHRKNSAIVSHSGYTASGFRELKQKFRLLLMAAPIMAWGQIPPSQPSAPNGPAIKSSIPLNVQWTKRIVYNNGNSKKRMIQESIPNSAASNTHPLYYTDFSSQISSSSSPSDSDGDNTRKDLDLCHIHEVKSLPGSHQFASDFIETMASDPDPRAKDPNVVWGLTADFGSEVPFRDLAMYVSKSIDGGVTWTQVARVDSKYFDAAIGEGLRNGLSVSPGGTDFVITTQKGAFQVLPQLNPSDTLVKSIMGPRVPHLRPRLSIAKKEGDPVRANVVKIMADGKHMIVGYGYFDLNPQMFSYHKDDDGSWVEDGPLPHLPTEMDILSMQFDDSKKLHPSFLYVGTGDQAYRLSFHTMKWTRIDGVGPDSAIHGMSTTGGLHLAACWGVYNPSNASVVKRVTDARFLLHRAKDQTGPNLRAYSIEVDPLKQNREVVTSITGVYTSKDSGKRWTRLNDLPDGEFRSAYFNSDGTVIISGIMGTFLANPFSNACSPHLKTRDK